MNSKSRNPDPPTGPNEARQTRIEEDLILIEAIVGGSLDHWHAFVDRFAGLIYSVIRRQLFVESDDDVRTVFADVLHSLYNGKLQEFRGKAELSTWLIVVARGMALDHLRKQSGRRKLPKGHDSLTPLEQDVFRLHHVEGLSFEVVLHSLESAGRPATADQVAHAILKIESIMDPHYLRRLEFESKAPALGISSGRLLDYMTRVRIQRERDPHQTPERALERKELAEMGERIRELLTEFPEEEREVMRLRFEEGYTAKDIAAQMGLPSQRRVYTVIDRAIQKLRKLLSDE